MLLFTLEVLHAKRKCFEDCFFNVKIIQGSYGSRKTKMCILEPLKNQSESWRSPGKVLEICFWKRVRALIITWSLCCWPQDLQRIINFELTDTSNNQHCTVLVKRSFCAQVSLSLKLQQRCNRRTHNETMNYSFLASIHCVIDVIIDDLPL